MSHSDIYSTTAGILSELTVRSRSDASVLHYVLLDKINMNSVDQEQPVSVECPKPDCLFPVSTYKVMSGWTALDTQNLTADNVVVYFTRIDIDNRLPMADPSTWDVYTKNDDTTFTRTRYSMGLPPVNMEGKYFWNKDSLTTRGIMMRRVEEGPVKYPDIYESTPTVMSETDQMSDDLLGQAQESSAPFSDTKTPRRVMRNDSANVEGEDGFTGGRKKQSKKPTKRRKKSKKTKRSRKIR